MATHIRKNIMLPADLDDDLRRMAAERGGSQSGLIAHLVRLGIAVESGRTDPLLRYAGLLSGPVDLSETVDQTVYGR
ncbi:MAG: hypothetical protein WAT58_12530 [Candidatus Dormiibacterota bacterium]